MAKLDVTSGTALGLGAGKIAIRPAGMAPQPASVTAVANVGTTDTDYVVSSESWQYAVAHIGVGGETPIVPVAAVTVQTKRKKVAVAWTAPGVEVISIVYRRRAGASNGKWDEYTETAANSAGFSDDGTQIWNKCGDQPKVPGTTASSYATITKGSTFTITSRVLANGDYQLVYRIRETDHYGTGFITLSQVNNQAGWTNNQAGADQAIADITSW